MAAKRNIRKIGTGIFFLLMVSVMLPWQADSAVSPSIEQVAGIRMDRSVLWSPGKLATGPDGLLYVVDSYKNHILKFSGDGSYAGDIPFSRVSTLSVAPNGILYVGSNIEYSVSIVKNGQVVGHLGKGKGEFRSVRDIAYDSAAGLVYVVDNLGNSVRIFDSMGNDIGSINGVNLPVGIAVSDGLIYVIDSPAVPSDAERGTASRISVFDRAYKLVATIDDYYSGQMFNPTSIACFDGIIYVADAALQGVLMFDKIGSFLGEIQGIDGIFGTAVSVAVSADGVLHVSSGETRNIEMFAITPAAAGRQGGLK